MIPSQARIQRRKALRILLVSHYYPAHRGGIELIADKIVEGLLGKPGLRIVWAASDTDRPPAGTQGLRCIPMRTANFTEASLGFPYPLWSPGSLLRLWREASRADVVHLHDYAYSGCLFALLAALRHRRPVLITQHIGFVPYHSLVLRAALSLLNATLGRLVLSCATQVVFYSEEVRSYFSRRTRFRRPSRMIPNGVDSGIFRPATAAARRRARRRMGFKPGYPLLLFVGRFVEKKGLDHLRLVAQRLRGVQWAFAGWGPLNPVKWGLANTRIFTGKAGRELVPLYQAADLLVLPSQGEGFPLVVQEAFSCGTPAMVGSDTARAYPPARPLLFHAKAGDAGTAHRWTIKIRRILRHPRLLRRKRGALSRFSARHWRWQTCVEDYRKLICNLGGRKVPSSRRQAAKMHAS